MYDGDEAKVVAHYKANLAYHESICWDLDYISGIHNRLVQVLGWMNQDMPVWLEGVDNFHTVVDSIRNSSAGLKL